MKPKICGLDFGTTNSAVAVFDDRVITIPHPETDDLTERSVIFFPNDELTHFIGNQAIEEYIEREMNGRFMQSVKTLLPESMFDYTYVRGKGRMAADDLCSLVISYFRDRVCNFLQEDIDQVVLGRPVIFSDDAEKENLAVQRLRSAAEKSGFKQVLFQYEPIAAALDYEQSLQEEQLVLVADFGGGTSDFTIMKLSPSNALKVERKDDILASAGVPIGGDILDSLIMKHKLLKYFGQDLEYQSLGKTMIFPNHILSKLLKWSLIPFLRETNVMRTLREIRPNTQDTKSIDRLTALIEESLGLSLFQSIEKAKIDLSEAETTKILMSQSIIQIKELLSLSEFSKIIEPKLSSIDSTLDQLFKTAGIEEGKIDAVFMTGGTSYIVALQEAFKARFGPDKIKYGKRLTSVVSGLAVTAHSVS